MRSVSETFSALHNAEADCEIRLNIAGTIYTKEEIFEDRLSSSSIPDDKPSVGNAIASQLQFGIEPKSTIPRMAEIKLELRLTDGVTTSEWLPYGTYYIDTRETTADGDYMEITAYDSMLKAEQTYKDLTAFATWPQTDTAIVNEICTLMGVELDSRTSLAGYNIGYPNDYTMREMLGYIGAANGGNWIITPENKLRLVPLAIKADVYAMSTEENEAILFGDSVIDIASGFDEAYHNIGRDMTAFSDLGALPSFTGVMLYYGDESAFSAGNNSGRVLEADMPWATQAMANALLSMIQGYVYHGFEAEKVNITPAFELGDIVRANGIVASIMSLDVVFDGAFYPDISAPSDLEVDNEYHYESRTERQFKRVVKLGEDYYGTTIDRENGITVTVIDDNQNIKGKVILNANELKFLDASNNPKLYLDPTTGQYYFNGNITIADGSISFGKLNASTKNLINSGAGANSTLSELGTSYSSVDGTYLDGTIIQSPTIKGNDIEAYNAFKVMNSDGNVRGYFGHGTGTGVGVMISYGSSDNVGVYDDPYVICTQYGVRMSFAGASVYIDEETDAGGSTDTVINLTTGNHTLRIDSTGIYADGNQLS